MATTGTTCKWCKGTTDVGRYTWRDGSYLERLCRPCREAEALNEADEWTDGEAGVLSDDEERASERRQMGIC